MTARPNTAQAIGALAAQIEAMNARLDRDREDRKEHDRDADKSRRELRDGIAALQKGHDAVLRRVDKIEPVADMVTSLKARVVGALAVIWIIGGIIISAVTYFKAQIFHFLGWG